MMDAKRIELENQILDKISGRVNYSQPVPEKEKIIMEAFQGFCRESASLESQCVIEYLGSEKAKEDFLKEFQGYGILDELLGDDLVEDIIINGTEPICVHHAKEGFKKTGKRFADLKELDLLIKKLLIFSGRTEPKKINNIDLLGMRGRVNIVYSPLGPELTITRLKENPLSIIQLVGNNTLNSGMAALLWLYVEGLRLRPANILISGGPGSGKTTLLNAMLSFITSDQHIVIIEDTFELVTGWMENVSRLESDDELSLKNLVKNSLRMRPERIIVGEVRGEEAQDMITAMNIGKYCLATIHASTVRETIVRLQSNPMNIPETSVSLIDAFIVMRKQKKDGGVERVVEEISETGGLEQKMVLLSQLWKFEPGAVRFNNVSPTNIYRDRLSQASGLSGKQILDEIALRKSFLELLGKHKIESVKEVSYFCGLYLKDAQKAFIEAGNYEKR
ncbi:MAG: ATPase, T2SS/T4P/T4SS family [Candidatus Omnitrophica bacterium]|nr:ATPase, T2SS/T4P/T4SS family [Candidatus Omnitrophota bacterium]